MLMTRLEVENMISKRYGRRNIQTVVERTKNVENYYIQFGTYKRIGRRLVVWDMEVGSILDTFQGYISTEEKGKHQVLYNVIYY